MPIPCTHHDLHNELITAFNYKMHFTQAVHGNLFPSHTTTALESDHNKVGCIKNVYNMDSFKIIMGWEFKVFKAKSVKLTSVTG